MTLWWFAGVALALAGAGRIIWKRTRALHVSRLGWIVASSYAFGVTVAFAYSYLTYFGQPIYYPPSWVNAFMRLLLWPQTVAFSLIGQSRPELTLIFVPWSIALQIFALCSVVGVGARALLKRGGLPASVPEERFDR